MFLHIRSVYLKCHNWVITHENVYNDLKFEMGHHMTQEIPYHLLLRH